MDKATRKELIREQFKSRKPSSRVVTVAKPQKAKWWLCYSTGKISRGTVAMGKLERDHWRASHEG